MKFNNPFLLVALSLTFFWSCNSAKVETIPGEGATVFTNVNVVPMTGQEVLNDQTVIIREGKIEKIATAGEIKVGEGAILIDGTGKFLMPGIAEMHAHIPVAQGENDSLVRETLLLYLSGGITTIRGMLGNPYHLELRQAVADGDILGPRVFTSSPSMNGNSVTSVQEAIDKTTQYQKDGYDFLKIHPGIQLDVFTQLVETAREVGIPFSGHVPVAVGIDRAIEFQYASIDHLDGYIDGLVPKSEDFDPAAGGLFGIEFTEKADEEMIPDIVRRTKEAGIWIVPTQVLLVRWTDLTTGAELVNEEGTQYLPSRIRFQWRQVKDNILEDNKAYPERNDRFIELRQALLREMETQGVDLLMGSDAPQVGNVPGFSIHYEIDALMDAGISNYTILESGTANPARFFQQEGTFGTIAVGAEADLLLLNANPLDNPKVIRDHEGVMVRGKWLSREWLEEELDKIAEKYSE
jgi:imidazolonepropionase-like amidohydrolase